MWCVIPPPRNARWLTPSRRTTTTTVVDNGTFKTKTEAETGMKDDEGLHLELRWAQRAAARLRPAGRCA